MIAHPNPIRAPFWTPGVLVLALLMGAGALAVLALGLCAVLGRRRSRR